MESIKKRLESLEARTPPPPRARPGRVTLADLRRLEEYVKRLESGAAPTSPAPVVESVAPDARVAAVVRELERLELLDHAREGSPRWGK
jgi:hypothetical protein